MEISDEAKKYIQLVEMQIDIKQGIDSAFNSAREMPVMRGQGNHFWLISNPIGNSEFIDTISLVDTASFANIAVGSPDRAELDYELYLETDESAAKRDAYNRWMNKFK